MLPLPSPRRSKRWVALAVTLLLFSCTFLYRILTFTEWRTVLLLPEPTSTPTLAELLLPSSSASPTSSGGAPARPAFPDLMHPKTTSLAFYTSTVFITDIEALAMRSWAACGPRSRVIVFVDDVDVSTAVLRRTLEPELLGRFQLVKNPSRGKSPASGKVRLDVLIEEAESTSLDLLVGRNHTENDWMTLINSDVFLTPVHCYAANSVLGAEELGLTGLRYDCTGNQLDFLKISRDWGKDVVFASQVHRRLASRHFVWCMLHGYAAMDFFSHRRGFFHSVMLSHRKRFSDLKFYLGVGKWDNALLHLARDRLIDVSPVGMLLHVTSPYDRNDTWRTTSMLWSPILNDAEVRANYTQVPDSVHNARQACEVNNRKWARYCGLKASVYDAAFRLCPEANVTVAQHADHAVYRATHAKFFSLKNAFVDEVADGRWAKELACPADGATGPLSVFREPEIRSNAEGLYAAQKR